MATVLVQSWENSDFQKKYLPIGNIFYTDIVYIILLKVLQNFNEGLSCTRRCLQPAKRTSDNWKKILEPLCHSWIWILNDALQYPMLRWPKFVFVSVWTRLWKGGGWSKTTKKNNKQFHGLKSWTFFLEGSKPLLELVHPVYRKA